MNYAELKAAIADTLNRQDLTAQIPLFVRLVEAQMRREISSRKDFDHLDLSGAQGSIGLPCDFAGVLSLTAYGQPNRKIVYMSPDMWDEQWLTSYSAPHYYTLTKTRLLFSPSVEFDGLLRYWKHMCPLKADHDSNWILDHHPDAYLYGACMHAAPYLKDDDRIGVWNGFYASAITAINAESVEQQAGAHVEIQSRSVV